MAQTCKYNALNRLTNRVALLGMIILSQFGYPLGAVGNSANFVEPVHGTCLSYDWSSAGQGGVRLLGATNGAISGSYAYDAGAKLTLTHGTTPNIYRYAGEQFDPDLGLYYLRARYPDPDDGGFRTMDSFEGNSSDPLSLRKYLYAHGDPVNMVDPSGHEGNLISTIVTAAKVFTLATIRTLGLNTARGKAAALVGVAVIGGNEAYWRTRVSSPSKAQQLRIDAASKLVAGTPGYSGYAQTAGDLTIRVVGIGETDEAGHVPVAWEVMLLWDEAINWELPILGSVIVHEAAHSDQWIHVGTWWHESEAYQIQSDFLHSVGVSGTVENLRAEYPLANDYFLDLADAFRKYNISNPAVTDEGN